MKSDQHIWRFWAEKAHRWGVEGMAASILEAAGPFTLVGAQAVYLFQPLLSSFLPDGHLTALAELLEQPDQARAFAEMLREGTAQ